MRTLLITLLLLVGSTVAGQNYYVAIIKGSVTYNGKVLKIRDKITPQGELRFSTADDYVKVSGPGGIFTLTPEQPTPGGGEFFIALREELFPAVRLRGSFSSAIGLGPLEPDYFGTVNWGSYLSNEVFPLREELQGFGQQLVFVVPTTDGTLHSIPAKVKDGALILDPALFDDLDIAPLTLRGNEYGPYTAAIAVINDPVAWAQTLASAESINELNWDDYTIAMQYSTRGLSMEDASEENMSDEELAARQAILDGQRAAGWAFPNWRFPEAAATVLDFFALEHIVDRRTLKRDFKRQIRAMRPQSESELMHDFFFDEYLQEVYGELVFTDDLRSMLDKYIERFRR